jgi:hypothetical protein
MRIKALNRSVNNSVQLTLGANWRHNQVLGSGPISAVASGLTPIRWTAGVSNCLLRISGTSERQSALSPSWCLLSISRPRFARTQGQFGQPRSIQASAIPWTCKNRSTRTKLSPESTAQDLRTPGPCLRRIGFVSDCCITTSCYPSGTSTRRRASQDFQPRRGALRSLFCNASSRHRAGSGSGQITATSSSQAFSKRWPGSQGTRATESRRRREDRCVTSSLKCNMRSASAGDRLAPPPNER